MSQGSFKDHFSAHSAEYAKHRPAYPEELYKYLSSVSAKHDLCWDVATGNGQAAIGLAPYFKNIIATDPSRNQIQNAFSHPTVTYLVESAEEEIEVSSDDRKADLITIATGLHWFDFEKFYQKCRLLSKRDTVIAAWTYDLVRSEELEALSVLIEEYHDEVDKYWPPERQYIKDHYRTIPWPFRKLYQDQPDVIETFKVERELTAEDLEKYLYTWSASVRYIEATGKDPMERIRDKLRAMWGNQKRKVQWPLFLLLGYVNNSTGQT
jgi:hypothetical protein